MNEKRNIKIVTPFLADTFIDFEQPIFDIGHYSKFLELNSDRIRTFKKYLIDKLHDSLVIAISKQPDSLTIILNDFSTHVFADAIIEKNQLNIAHEKLVFPLTIEFKGNLKVEYNTVDENGFLNKITPIDLDEYLHEHVTDINKERIEVIFSFWKNGQPGEKVIIIASARNLTVTENQDQAWQEIFGDRFDQYYNFFKEQFNSDKYVSDYSECLKLIDEFDNNSPLRL